MECARVACNLLNLLSIAGIIVDGQGVALAVSDEARRIIGPEMAIVDNRLFIQDQENRMKLLAALQEAPGGGGRRTILLAIRRKEKRPLIANVIDMKCSGSAPKFLIRVRDLELRGSPPIEVLRACFGLSRAEAKLAALLVAGETLSAAATTLNIKKETARTQLKSIMAKLGVTRQADFLVLAGKL